MKNLDINTYLGKVTGDPLDASEWNEIFNKIQDKVNELIGIQREDIMNVHVEDETLVFDLLQEDND